MLKIKKNKVVPCRAIADKLVGEWSPRELQPSETKNLGD